MHRGPDPEGGDPARDARRRANPPPGGTLIGIAASDGAILAADTRTTRGSVVRGDAVEKLVQVHPTGAMGSTDDLGPARAFVRRVRARVKRDELLRGEPMSLAALATFAAEALRQTPPGAAAFVLGGVDDDGSQVYMLGPDEGSMAVPYVAVGSGRATAFGVLEDADTASLSLAGTRRLAERALERAAARDARTGSETIVAEITVDGVDIQV